MNPRRTGDLLRTLFNRISMSCVITAILAGNASAQIEDPDKPQPAQRLSVNLTLKGPINPKALDSDPPPPLESKHVEPPYGLIGQMGIKLTDPKQELGFGLGLFFPKYSLIPMVEIEGRFKMELKPNFELYFGGALAFQNTVSKSPIKDTQLSTTGISPYFGLEESLGDLTLDGQIKMKLTNNLQLANFEDLPTNLSFATTYGVLLGVAYQTPLSLKLAGGLDAYSVGNSAIASKEFAISLRRTLIYKTHIGFALPIMNCELGIKYFRVFRVADPESLYFQAPWLTSDYLLSKSWFEAQLKWKF